MKKTSAAVLAPSTRPAPVVLKVDPPSWWTGSTINPLRLMIRGRHLQGAAVKSTAPGLVFGQTRVNAAGTCLFVNVKIAPSAAPGERSFCLRTPGGETRASFTVVKPRTRKDRPARFGPDDVLYLIMPDRFAQGGTPPPDPDGLVDRALGRSYHGGNLRGIIARLPYLKELGVTALWLTPIYANHDGLFDPTYYSAVPFTDYHGYGPVDFFAVDRHFGDLPTLVELVDKAHAAGVKIILDQVANHSSPKHPWVEDPPTPGWFHGTTEKHLNNPFHHWHAADPYSSPETLRVILDGWLGDLLPDLNQDDPEVERYLIQSMAWWAGMTGVDGLRHDSLNYVPRPFWKKCMAVLKREFPGLHHVGEVNSDDPYLVSFFQGGRRGFDGLDLGIESVFDFPLRKAMRSVFLDGKPISELAAALSRDRLYPDPSRLVTFLGLHDDWRFMNHPAAGPAALKLAFTFLLTTRGIPMIYAGDEIALPGGDDPDNRRDFPGGWPGDPRDAFAPAGRTPLEADVHRHVAALTRLRAACAPLRVGKLAYLASNERVYAYARHAGSSWAIVALNNSEKTETLEFGAGPVRLSPRAAALKDQLGGRDARVADGRIKIEIPARTSAIYTREA